VTLRCHRTAICIKKKKREALNTLLITISFRRVRKTAKIYYLLRHVCPPAWNNSTPTGRIFIKLHIWVWSFFFPKTVKKMKFWLNSDNNKYFTWIPTYMCGIISELFLELEILQIEVVEKIKTHAMFNKFFLKIVPFVRQCEKIRYSQTGQRWPKKKRRRPDASDLQAR